MIARTAILLFGTLLLSACSSLNGLLESEEPLAPPPEAVVSAAPTQPEREGWCQRVAASERARMQASGFDAATLDRMTLATYQQCRATPQ